MAAKKKAKRRKIKMRRVRPLSAKRRAEMEHQYVLDTSNIGFLQVVAFGHEPLREAFRVWWHPFRGMGEDFDKLCGNAVVKPYKVNGHLHGMKRVKRATVMSGETLMLDKLDPSRVPLMRRRMRGDKLIKTRCPVKVRLTIDYPVTEKQTKIVKMDRRYPGEIFAMLHDFYREIYAKDEWLGGKPGPMNGGKGPLLNRGGGPLVWGHDIGDLCVETVHYKGLKKDPDGAEGEFTFGIGS